MRFSLVTSVATGLMVNIGFAQVYFKDKAAELNLLYSCGFTSWGNGISFYDYNGDGWDDLTVNSESGERLFFFRNINGAFTEDLLIIPPLSEQTRQVNWVDFDNDGDKDLFVTSDVSGNRLFENDGNMGLTDITASTGLPTVNMYTFGSSWGDYNNDGLLDLFVSNRDEVSFTIPNFLYRNNGDGTFTDVTIEAGLELAAHSSFCAVFFDYNNDGYQDIFVANDRLIYPNFLYRNNGNGTFTEVGSSSNVGTFMNGMSATVGDINNDGWFDLYVTNTSEGNSLFLNNGDETFTDIAVSSGTAFNAYGWGSVFFDPDLDKDQDLYVSGLYNTTNTTLLPYAYFQNDGSNIFSEPINTGFEVDDRSSFSNAIGDYNNDGLIDLAVANNQNTELFIWKNESTTANNWLKVKLEGVSSNRDGIGAVIEVGIAGQSQYFYTACGEGYLSQNSQFEIIGLGDATNVDFLKIKWLGGSEDVFFDLAVNQTLEITEGTGTLSVPEISDSANRIFPNPVSETLNIRSDNVIDQVSIHDIRGRLILMLDYVQSKEVSIPIENFIPSIYIVQIKSLSHTFIEKIVKE